MAEFDIQVRIDRETVEKIEKCCERTGLSKADVIRLGIDKVYTEQENERRR